MNKENKIKYYTYKLNMTTLNILAIIFPPRKNLQFYNSLLFISSSKFTLIF